MMSEPRLPWKTMIALAATGLLFQSAFFLLARNCQVDAIRERLQANAAAASLAVDGDLLAQVRTPADAGSPAHARILAQLRRLTNIHSDLCFAYTMRLDGDGTVRFVVDAQSEQDRDGDGRITDREKPAAIGEAYPEATADLRRGFQVPSVDVSQTRDRWGRVYSGYAPVRNGRNEVVGLVGLDMDLFTLDGKLWRLDAIFLTILAFYVLVCTAMILLRLRLTNRAAPD